MKVTFGKIMFYGGITGIVLCIGFFVFLIFYLKKEKKKLEQDLKTNY